MIITGVNVNAGGELGPIASLSCEQFTIPPVNASIGGASYGSAPFHIPPFRGLIVAGVVATAVAMSVPSVAAGEHPPLVVEISVDPGEYMFHGGQMTGADLRQAYEDLRRQMLSEGIPFLNAAELEREITDRKGTRS
jgi:hypothetical protein